MRNVGIKQSRPRGGGGGPPAGKFVSPTAVQGAGDGSFGNPWHMWDMIGAAVAGDRIWLRGGTYSIFGTYFMTLTGTAGSPITIGSYPGEWAVIREDDRNSTAWDMYGAYLHIRDFEVTNPSTDRLDYGNVVSTQRGINVNSHVQNGNIINMVLTDAGSGIGAWVEMQTCKIHGNLILDTGWVQNGPGTYMNNAAPYVKDVSQNIVANGWENAFKAGTDNGYVNNMDIHHNTIVNMIRGTECYANNNPMTGTKFRNNRTWAVDDAFVHFYGGTAVDQTVKDNWLCAGRPSGLGPASSGGDVVPISFILPVTSPTLTGNTVYARVAAWGGSRLVADYTSATTRTYDNNNYYAPSYLNPGFDPIFQLGFTDYLTLAAWRTATSAEASSTYTAGIPADQVWVDVNENEIGRANITIYNENAAASSVTVNVDSVLANGQAWWLFNATNPRAGAIASGTYTTGAGISVPMTTAVAGPCRTPAGASAAASQLPNFGVFVLRRVSSWVAPPVALMT